MIEKSEDDISEECLRLLKLNKITRFINHVSIVPIGPSGTPDNWTYGVLDPNSENSSAQDARRIILEVASRWRLKD